MSVTATIFAAEPSNLVEWFQDSSQRQGPAPSRNSSGSRCGTRSPPVSIAIAIAVPMALVLAHFRKAELLSAWLVNIGRVVPTVTIIGVAVLISLRNGFGFEPWPILFALVAMALPPIYSNTYTAVRGVDENVVARLGPSAPPNGRSWPPSSCPSPSR